MRRINVTPKSLRAFTCPQCDKPRMMRDFEHIVSFEKRTYDTKDGNKVELFIDTCEFCKKKNFHKWFEPSRADIRKILKSMREDAELSGEQSLEELL